MRLRGLKSWPFSVRVQPFWTSGDG
jgi:2-keto-4-pentenoate hydratase/2-oxohepta-3-ene-1,7-dioic acid hydratase in catechol pathway